MKKIPAAATTRILILALSLVLLSAVHIACHRPQFEENSLDGLGHERTNVLWLTLCTLRADHLGAYGYEPSVSPFIDGLAGRGIIFERALAQAPWTRASIASSITSLYPRSLNIEERKTEINDRILHDSFTTIAEVMKENGYFTIGVTANPNTNVNFNFNQGYDVYLDTRGLLWRSGYGRNKHTAHEVNEHLLEQLRGPAKDRKFFAHLVYVDVHSPLLTQKTAGQLGQPEDLDLSSPVGRYDFQLRYLDTAIGELVGRLSGMGLEDTLIIVTSDHGEGFGLDHEHDRGHGATLYNSTIWVPFILYHPSLEKHTARFSGLVELTDVIPTLLDLLGIPFESEAFAGHSLAPLISGETKTPERPVSVVETAFQAADNSAILAAGWKLIVQKPPGGADSDAGEPVIELYRYDEDRHETRDRSAEELDVVSRLSDQLAEWQRVHSPLVPEDELFTDGADASTTEALKTLGYLE